MSQFQSAGNFLFGRCNRVLRGIPVPVQAKPVVCIYCGKSQAANELVPAQSPDFLAHPPPGTRLQVERKESGEMVIHFTDASPWIWQIRMVVALLCGLAILSGFLMMIFADHLPVGFLTLMLTGLGMIILYHWLGPWHATQKIKLDSSGLSIYQRNLFRKMYQHTPLNQIKGFEMISYGRLPLDYLLGRQENPFVQTSLFRGPDTPVIWFEKGKKVFLDSHPDFIQDWVVVALNDALQKIRRGNS